MKVKGHVVFVRGDYVKVAFRDEDLKHVARRGKFLKIITKDGTNLIGMVASMELSDELYRQARTLSLFPESYEDLILRKNDVLVTLLGTLTESGVERKIEVAPMPGDIVEPLSDDELKRIFGGDKKNYIKIGSLVYESNVSVNLDLNQLATKHVAILAMTGAGKSNTLATLIVRILSRLPAARIIVIDTHSEYIQLVQLAKRKNINVTVFCPVGKFRQIIEKHLGEEGIVKNLEIPYWWLNIEEWYALLGLGYTATTQRRLLRMALREIKGQRTDIPLYFDMIQGANSLENKIRTIGAKNNYSKNSVESLLDKIDDVMESEEYEFIFNPTESFKVKDDPKKVFRKVLEPIITPGLKIIALGGIPSEVQTAVVSMLLRTLFRIAVEAKLKGKAVPTIVAIEEAHIYAPADSYAPSKSVLERIAKEGRKFGIGLIIISQRPKELSGTVLAQCGTLIALRIRNPSDQKYILESVEDMTWYMIQSLSGLGVGEALISGFATPIPCIAKIDAFSKAAEEEFGVSVELGGRDIDVVNEWSKVVTSEDIEAIIETLYEGYEATQKDLSKAKESKPTKDLLSILGGNKK